jgi:glycosyltransferase involved in cell wall biosynthesis
MCQYDAFVLPTKATTEGYPGVVLEAYAAGLPVIATTCGAIPEIVDETSGILLDPGDVDGLEGAMKRLVEDPQLYVRLCEGTRERTAQFSAAHWAEEFVACCREVAEKNSRT